METNKTILLREVISIDDRKTVGAVKDICVDCEQGKVSHYIIGDMGLSALSLLPREKAIAVGDSFVTIQKESVMLPTDNRSGKALLEEGCRLVGIEVFSGTGNRLGSVAGFTFATDSGDIASVSLNDGSIYTAKDILFFSPQYVFVKDSAQATAAPVASAPQQTVASESVPVDHDEPEVSESPQDDKAQDASDENQALRELLLGKKVSEDIASTDGSFKLSKGDEITEEVLDRAQAHDALLLLTLGIDV